MWHKHRQFVILAAVVAVLLGASAAIRFGGRATGPNPAGPQHIARGQEIYAAHCAVCHGANLEGQANWRQRGPDGLLPAPPHDATGHTWHHPDRQLFTITKLGTAALVGGDYKSNMKGFGEQLSDGDINAVIGFIKSRWPEEIRRRQTEITVRAGPAQ